MERGITLQEMLKGLWRRRRLVLLVAAAVFAVGVAIVASLPSTYRATTVVRGEPQRPSTELVWPNNTMPIEQRLAAVRVELFSRPLLQRTVEELNLYPKLREKRGLDAAIGELATQLDVRVEGEMVYVLEVTGSDPKQAAAIANTLPRLYSEEVLETRARHADLTAKLFDDELGRVGARVQEIEAQITAFKLAHLGELPEQLEPNMRGFERSMAEVTARTEARREMMRRAAEIDVVRSDAETEVGRLRRRELDLNRDLIAARSQWTETHPEVERLERELATVRAKRNAAETGQQETDSERGFVRGQIAALTAEMKALQSQADMYRERLDRTPQWAQELAVMNRDYELLRTKYQSLLSRKVEAEVSRDLEAKSRAATFNVLTAAEVPAAPFKPDRANGLLLALIAALGAGLLAGVFRELQDDSLRGVEQARELAMPVLATVPKIPTGGSSRERLQLN